MSVYLLVPLDMSMLQQYSLFVDLCENPIIEYVNSKLYIALLTFLTCKHFVQKTLIIVPHQCVYCNKKFYVYILGRSFI